MTELFLINGRLHTQDARYPDATAVAIRDGRVQAVGDDDEIRALAGPNARVIDLEGRLLLPAMIDSHFHYYDWSLGLRRLPLSEAHSLDDLKQRLARWARETPPGPCPSTGSGPWIMGQGWNESRWPEPRMPTRADLDEAAPDHPVIIWRNDLHLAVVNSRALQEAGITADTPNPPEGVINRDQSGEPNGILRELAINLVSDIIPPPTEEETVDVMREGFGILHRLGLTGVHDYRIMGGADGPPAFRAYQRLQATGELALRMWMHIPSERLDEAIALGLRTGMGDDYLRVGHVKLFADGGQGARTAWMLEPYQDTGDCGMPLTPMGEIARAVERADRAGLAVAIHAIGDRANRELIGVFEQVLGDGKKSETAPPTALHRIEHVQVIRPEDVARLARLDVAASVQPIHCPDDIPMVETSVGPRARFAYPFRDFQDAGVTMAFGSDCPVANPNPMFGIHAAVTRQTRDGAPEGGWYPEQRLTVAEAIWGFTMGAALVSGREAHLGSITPGKLADLILLDRDILALDRTASADADREVGQHLMKIAQTQVVMTIFDGRVVYEA
jgi:predicted amidohydrolase YtcJ